jgi:enamine deaminase RidA (YjgF/YER057c/UK114 family)
MNKTYNPSTVSQPAGYSHGVELAPNARILYIAGQLGVAPDGSFARDITGQAEQAWRNIQNVLAAAGMSLENLVKVNHYITRKEDLAGYRAVRSRVLGE